MINVLLSQLYPSSTITFLTCISSRLRTKGSFEMGHPTLACHTVFVCTVPCLPSRVYVQQCFTSTSITNKFQENCSGFYFDAENCFLDPVLKQSIQLYLDY